jgi:hypothetical protein
MRIFVIEAFGGREATDGGIARFTVHADTVDEAIDVIRHSATGQRYDRFEVIEETGDFEADTPGIIEEQHGTAADEG